MVLLGRLQERAALSRLLEAARSGRSGVLVLRGEPGVGKTALLEYAVESAAGLRVARVAGVESEMELAYAALQQLCGPMLGNLERVPGPQRDALRVAFGLSTGAAPDRFLVGLAALSLLSEVAEHQPLLCVVDDAQWLDRASAQVLGFVGRRLLAESVALVFATREPGEDCRGLPELPVGGLSDGDARVLLGSVVRGPLDERVRDRIIAEAHGNPLALLELPRDITPAELAGGFGLPSASGVTGRIEDSFRRRLEAMPAATQRLMLVAAAEPAGEPAVVWQAAGQLGIGAEAALPAADAGLLTIGERVTFRHPLVRSAVYRAASPPERRAVHRALADATDRRADPDRRAWHRAQATPGPDEDVALELERSAGRAQARGGLAAAAAFLERAAALTLDPTRRADRALAAARAKHQAGAFDAAMRMLATAEAGPPDQLRSARADLLRGQVAFASSRGSDAPPLLLKAGYPAGAPVLRRAVSAFRGTDVFKEEGLRWLWLASHAAEIVLDHASWDVLSDCQVTLARDAGALIALPIAFNTRARVHLFAGEFAEAASMVAQAESVTYSTGSSIAPYGALTLAVFRGREAQAAQLIQTATDDAGHRGEGEALSFAQWAAAVLANSLGRYEEALEAAQRASEDSPTGRFASWALVELVEAAARSGAPGHAAGALQRLSRIARACGTDWALGAEARSRALASDGEAAEDLYREAIDRFGRARLRVDLARARLLYGEWLRRQRRRRDARDQLGRAYEIFDRIGAAAFAERARTDLRATGGHARQRAVGAPETLTAQEALIARLAGEGASNPEIAAQLFISPATVAYHLRKVFTKLSVSSRGQLAAALPAPQGGAPSVPPQG